MPTLHFYLLRQVVTVMAVSLCVFIGVLLMGSALKDVLAMLVNQQVGVGAIAKILGLQIPWLLSFALPLGLLAGVLLAFGRISADQELVAINAGGISLAAASWPVLMFSVLMCGLAAWINLNLAPSCRIASKRMAHVLVAKPVDVLLPGRYIRDFPGWTIYIGKKDDQLLKEVLLYGYDEKGRQNRRIEAATATYTLNETNKVLSVELSDARYYLRTSEAVEDEGMDTQAMSTWEIFTWGSASQELDMSRLMNAELKPDLSEMTWSQLRDELAQARTGEIAAGPIVFHLHRQVAGAFACVCFALVGIPLGIRANRRETSVGIAMALLVALLYYGIQVFAQSLEGKQGAYLHLLIWMPNFVFIGLGCWLFRRSNRGCLA